MHTLTKAGGFPHGDSRSSLWRFLFLGLVHKNLIIYYIVYSNTLMCTFPSWYSSVFSCWGNSSFIFHTWISLRWGPAESRLIGVPQLVCTTQNLTSHFLCLFPLRLPSIFWYLLLEGTGVSRSIWQFCCNFGVLVLIHSSGYVLDCWGVENWIQWKKSDPVLVIMVSVNHTESMQIRLWITLVLVSGAPKIGVNIEISWISGWQGKKEDLGVLSSLLFATWRWFLLSAFWTLPPPKIALSWPMGLLPHLLRGSA